MKRWLLLGLLGAGCSAGGHFIPLGDGGIDLSQSRQDLAGADLSQPPGADLAGAQDLAQSGADLAQGQADLSTQACALVLNEVQTGGAGGADDEFVEIHNPCAGATDLGGYTLAYRSAAGVTDQVLTTFAQGLLVPGQGLVVIGSTTYTGASDATFNGGHLAAAGGGLALRDANGATLDSVGWGTATNAFVESAVAPAPGVSQSIERIPNGFDSDDNSADFLVGGATTPGSPNQ
jgi:hypothetical protein